MTKDFQVPWTEFKQERDSFKCTHCNKNKYNKPSFIRYGCVPHFDPYILCRDCAYKSEYGTKKSKKAKEENRIENKITHKEPQASSK
jgi:hypothetical protein